MSTEPMTISSLFEQMDRNGVELISRAVNGSGVTHVDNELLSYASIIMSCYLIVVVPVQS